MSDHDKIQEMVRLNFQPSKIWRSEDRRYRFAALKRRKRVHGHLDQGDLTFGRYSSPHIGYLLPAILLSWRA